MEVLVFLMLGLSALAAYSMMALAVHAAQIGARLLEHTRRPDGRRSGRQWGLGCLLAWAVILACRALVYEADRNHVPYTFYLAWLVAGEAYVVPGIETIFHVTLTPGGTLTTSLPLLAVGSLIPAALAACVTDKPRHRPQS